MPRKRHLQNAATDKIYASLKNKFPNLSANKRSVVYQSGDAIRLRVIDQGFAGVPVEDREEALLPLLNALPLKVRAGVTTILLLTPEEAIDPGNVANRAFDDLD